ncbi:hypothetical protein Ddc_06052 [Ditylenchus destructor]|nr:hypothetical protein Ddc_06052 [Ditylenchus destructor]
MVRQSTLKSWVMAFAVVSMLAANSMWDTWYFTKKPPPVINAQAWESYVEWEQKHGREPPVSTIHLRQDSK